MISMCLSTCSEQTTTFSCRIINDIVTVRRNGWIGQVTCKEGMVPGDSDSLGSTSSHPLPTNTRLLRLQKSDKFWFTLVRLRPCLGLRCRQLQLIATVDPTSSVNWLDSLQGTEPLGTGRPKSLRRAQNHRRYVTHIAHEWTNSFPTCKRLKVRHERHAKIPLSLSPWITSHLMIYIEFI